MVCGVLIVRGTCDVSLCEAFELKTGAAIYVTGGKKSKAGN